MAGAEFQGIGFRDFSGGIDALSSEDHIRDGYVQELMNMEPTPEGYVRKRKGWRRVLGGMPLRAKVRALVGSTLTITFESAYSILDFSNVPRLPILVVGRRSATTETVYGAYGQITASTTDSISLTISGASWGNATNGLALTVWGIDIADLVVPTASDEQVTWVKHITEYSDGEDLQSLLAVFQGTVYQSLSSAFPSYISGGTRFSDFPSTVTNFNLTVSGVAILGPCFYGPLATPTRTRGHILANETSNSHTLHASAAQYQSGTGYVRYTIPLTGGVVSGTPLLADYDYLTCSGAGYSVNNGAFLIKAIDLSTIASDYITIDVLNENRDSTDFDETSAGIEVGVFTDCVPHGVVWASVPWIPQDKLYSAAIVDTVTGDPVMNEVSDAYTVHAFSTGYAWVSGVLNETAITGITFSVYRTSPLLMITAATDDTTTFVCRDVVNVDGNPYSTLHWFHPATLPTYSATANGDGTVEITPSSGTTRLHREGGYIYLKGALVTSKFNGIYEIQDLDSTTGKFTVTNEDFTGTEALSSRNYCLEIDMAVEHTGGSTVAVPERWYPVEPFNSLWDPGTSITQTCLLPEERPFFQVPKKDLTYNNSIQMEGKTFICGESSPPIKVLPREDGASDLNFLHLGLPRWQPHCSIVEDAITAGGTLSAGIYSYYFRLEYTDQFGKTMISAPSLLQVTAAGTSRMEIKLAVPGWIYYLDLDNIYIKVFRTIAGGAVYYQAYTVSLEKSVTYMPYVTLTDNLSDALLILGGADSEALALSATDLITTLDTPPASKYMTALSNRLVLGNIQAPMRFRLSLETPYTLTAAAMADTSIAFSSPGGIGPGATFVFKNSATAITGITQGATSGGKTSYRIQTGGSSPLIGAGTWIQLIRNAAVAGNPPDLYLAGWHQVVTAVNTGDFTIQIDEAACPPPGAAVSDVDYVVFGTDMIPIWVGVDYFMGDNLGNVSSTVSMNAVVLNRLSRAINALVSYGSSERLALYAAHGPDIDSNLNSMHIWGGSIYWGDGISAYFDIDPGSATALDPIFFWEDTRVFSGSVHVAYPRKFPSRLAVSFENKPETFDATHYSVAANSLSCIDVNPSDGQEITGIIPFFGDSVSGGSTREAVMIVFKERSIYAVNVKTGDVQKLETRNLGCEAPESIQYTNEGIIFANKTGIFRLNKSMNVEDIGQFIERKWDEKVQQASIRTGSGFLSTTDRAYIFSYPVSGETSVAPDQGFAYWYRKEDRGGIGAWSELDGLPAVTWHLWEGKEYFAIPGGQVCVRREAGDFYDDAAAIDAYMVTRPESFGSISSRKHIPNYRISFRNVTGSNEDTLVYFTKDTEVEIRNRDFVDLEDGTSLFDNLGDERPRRIEVIQFSNADSRCNLAQVTIRNDQPGKDLQVTEVAYTVAGLPVGKGMHSVKDSSTL